MTEFIQFEKVQGRHGQWGHITLNRPKALNSLNGEMIMYLHHVLDECEKDLSVLGVIVQSVSEKAFCAGGDIRTLYDKGQTNPAEVLDFFAEEYRLNAKIYHYSKPYVCFLNGITMGGGVGISLHGSHAIAGENFRFAMPETAIGLFPDVGGSHLLHQCPDVYGLYLGLTGARIGREDAHALNLVEFCVDTVLQPKLIQDLHDLLPKEDIKSEVSAAIEKYHVEPKEETIFHRLPWINTVFSEKSVQEMMESLKLMSLKNSDIAQTYQDMLTRSPRSLAVTFEQLKRTEFLSMDDCLKMDYLLVSHFIETKDLYEGIRALIIDKDNQPKWDPPTLVDVTESIVSEYFNE